MLVDVSAMFVLFLLFCGTLQKMVFVPFTISAVKALKDLADLGLNKNGKKSATVENLTAILNQNGVQIRPIPSDIYQVRFQRIKMAAVFSQQSVCLARN
jgi:hypothetical protein